MLCVSPAQSPVQSRPLAELNVRRPRGMMGRFFFCMPCVSPADGWRSVICSRRLRAESGARGERNALTDGSGLTNYPHSPLSVGTSGLNPRTFFKLVHSFAPSVSRFLSRSEHCCVKHARVQSFRLWRGLSVWKRRRSVTSSWPAGDGLCLTGWMFGISICRMVPQPLYLSVCWEQRKADSYCE